MPIEEKPSRNEDEYFVKQDAELIKQRRAQLDAERAKLERQTRSMKCPKCGAELQEREYHNVKIDACPSCGGVWLDAGELELVAHLDRGANVASRLIGTLLGTRR
jgi:ribosomal protein L37AE/L43A